MTPTPSVCGPKTLFRLSPALNKTISKSFKYFFFSFHLGFRSKALKLNSAHPICPVYFRVEQKTTTFISFFCCFQRINVDYFINSRLLPFGDSVCEWLTTNRPFTLALLLWEVNRQETIVIKWSSLICWNVLNKKDIQSVWSSFFKPHKIEFALYIFCQILIFILRYKSIRFIFIINIFIITINN